MHQYAHSITTVGRLAIKHAIAVIAGVCLSSAIAAGAEPKSPDPGELPEQLDHKFSDRFTVKLDPAAKQQLGEDVYREIVDFFDIAEDAIDVKDLKAHMATYSENYRDGDKDKQAIEEIWKRIFAKFERVVIHHNLKLVTASADKQMIILRSSGYLLAEPDPKKRLVTIDNWSDQDFVLVKEGGKWKVISTFGEERQRFWFEKPMHPLF
jgi:hypothetical protein